MIFVLVSGKEKHIKGSLSSRSISLKQSRPGKKRQRQTGDNPSGEDHGTHHKIPQKLRINGLWFHKQFWLRKKKLMGDDIGRKGRGLTGDIFESNIEFSSTLGNSRCRLSRHSLGVWVGQDCQLTGSVPASATP